MAQRSDLRVSDTGVAGSPRAPLAGGPPGTLAPALASALAAPPKAEKQVLEVALDWGSAADRSSSSGAGWAANRLRTFVLTWDPFEWLASRAAAFATTARRADGAGLVLYLPHWQALRLAGGDLDSLGAVLGQLGESVLSVAGEQQSIIVEAGYPDAVAVGRAPTLLSRIPPAPALPTPAVTMVGDGWHPIGFDVLEDLAQDAFGPADLDRSPVRFSQPGSVAGCPACQGAALDFPDGLTDVQSRICDAHRAEALRITTARLESAKASNPAGWEALVEAGQHLLEPHLPDGLGPRLLAAATRESPSRPELAAQAELLAEAVSLIGGLPDATTALGARLEPVRAWLAAFADRLAAQGLTELAAAAGTHAAALLAAPEPGGDVASSASGTTGGVASGTADRAGAPSPKLAPYRRPERVGRNAPCPCGSGKKYKFCHGATGG